MSESKELEHIRGKYVILAAIVSGLLAIVGIFLSKDNTKTEKVNPPKKEAIIIKTDSNNQNKKIEKKATKASSNEKRNSYSEYIEEQNRIRHDSTSYEERLDIWTKKIKVFPKKLSDISYWSHSDVFSYFATCHILEREKNFNIFTTQPYQIVEYDLREHSETYFQKLMTPDTALKYFFNEDKEGNSILNVKDKKVINFRLKVREILYELSYSRTPLSPYFRNEKIVKKLWSRNKKLLFTIMDKEKYRDYEFNKVVNTLIDSYRFLAKENMDEIFFPLIEGRAKGIYEDFRLIPRNSDVDKTISGTGKWNEYFRSWFYSFWYRRYLEGNAETIYEILKEIQDFYEK